MLHVSFVDASSSLLGKTTVACLPNLEETVYFFSNTEYPSRLMCGKVTDITLRYFADCTLAIISVVAKESPENHLDFAVPSPFSTSAGLTGLFYDDRKQILKANTAIYATPAQGWTIQFKSGDEWIEGCVSRVEYMAYEDNSGASTAARIFFVSDDSLEIWEGEPEQTEHLPEVSEPRQDDNSVLETVQSLFAGINGRLDALEKLLDGVNDSSTQASPQQIPVIQEQQAF